MGRSTVVEVAVGVTLVAVIANTHQGLLVFIYYSDKQYLLEGEGFTPFLSILKVRK